MEDKDIKQQFHLLQKEVETAGARIEDTRLNLVAAIDTLKLEIEILKRFMERYHADFARRYPELRDELMREVDLEWLAPERTQHNAGEEGPVGNVSRHRHTEKGSMPTTHWSISRTMPILGCAVSACPKRRHLLKRRPFWIDAITGLDTVAQTECVEIECEAPDDELLFVDWLNALVYEMANRRMLFSRFEVHLDERCLRATAWGEAIDITKHEPAVEEKGATYTELRVTEAPDGSWLAQCVVDV